MQNWYMVTVVGEDRPGIVAALTEVLFKQGAQLGEASMVRLGGNFTIMLMVNTDASMVQLEKALAPLMQSMGLRLHLDQIKAHLHAHLEPNAQVSVFGADRPGIVAEVTGALAKAGFNILDLNSDVGGTVEKPIYVMLIDGHAEHGTAALEAALAPVRRNGIEVRVTPIDTLIG